MPMPMQALCRTIHYHNKTHPHSAQGQPHVGVEAGSLRGVLVLRLRVCTAHVRSAEHTIYMRRGATVQGLLEGGCTLVEAHSTWLRGPSLRDTKGLTKAAG